MNEAEFERLQRRERELEVENARLRAQVGQDDATPARITTAATRSTPVGAEELFSVVEKTRMPMILTDPNQPDNPIIFANRAFQELSGYSSDELLGRNCRFLQGPDTDPADVAQIRQALGTGQDIALEILNHRRDDTPFVNELYISPVFDRDGQLLYHFGSQLNVTGYRKDRRRLEETERQLRAIFDSAVDIAIIATDRDGRVTEWNAGAEHVLGWCAAEMLGQTAERFFTPEDRAAGRVEIEMRLALEHGRASDERWHTKRDGTRFWASGEMMPLRSEGGEHIGFIKILRDRTAQHRMGEALAESEAYWRGLFSQLQEGLVVGQVVRNEAGRIIDWRYLDVNPAWDALVGIPTDTVVGRTVRELIPGIEDIWITEVAAVVDGGEAGAFVRQVGSLRRWYEGRIRRIGSDRFSIIFREVTQQHEAERRRVAMQELSDRLREETDPSALALAGCEVIGRTLGAGRVGYGRMETDGEIIVVEQDWTAPGFPNLAGRLRLDDFGTYAHDLRRGETVVVPDVQHDARTTDTAERLAGISTRTLINIPVLERGRIAAVLYVNDAQPRAWTDEETAFTRDMMGRMRQAIERRRAEQELQSLAASLERQVEDRTRELHDARDFTRLALTSVGGVGVWTYEAASDRFFCSPAISELYALDPTVAERGISRARVHRQRASRRQGQPRRHHGGRARKRPATWSWDTASAIPTVPPAGCCPVATRTTRTARPPGGSASASTPRSSTSSRSSCASRRRWRRSGSSRAGWRTTSTTC